MRLVSTAIVMFIYWLALSGHSDAWLVGSGAVVACAVAAFAWRIGCGDEEGHPIHLIPRGLIYWPWLVMEIIKSALDVTALILNPRLPISPTLLRVKAGQRTAVGLTIYANSITLTPGTISAEISSRDREILVHALSGSAADGLATGEMDAKVSWFERGRS